MFSLLSGFLRWLWSTSEVKIAILGLDGAGKTTLLNHLKGRSQLDTIPTIGFNLAKVKIGSVSAIFWDLGGQLAFRSVWQKYYSETDGVLFLVDSSDADRFGEARKCLHGVLSHPDLGTVPVLLLANKQDLPQAAHVDEIARRLELKTVEVANPSPQIPIERPPVPMRSEPAVPRKELVADDGDLAASPGSSKAGDATHEGNGGLLLGSSDAKEPSPAVDKSCTKDDGFTERKIGSSDSIEDGSRCRPRATHLRIHPCSALKSPTNAVEGVKWLISTVTQERRPSGAFLRRGSTKSH
ncbi:unnamed protein product [Vitrella brassicaformis CCMP3155]|uniref:Uncharacterized protein n=1 Tax=Vitrella brassicaformis (strain CCMP3155) TaxID=1169540 RepID=A0A0G4ESJ4_VITBC|nr:unnamed protein product [Vitrella brassicaformis CCMP3155]|eukprot:CEM00888.1 unnamed protein product [Vitrella brassicaformis CCMP3155]